MKRHKLLIFPIFCLIFFILQSCVHGDLDDCPPMVRYAVAFQYTNTNRTKALDRFYDDVKKINLYVFDENNLIYTTTTKISPYESNFNIPLDLPMGKYHIIAWGNVLDDANFTITPEDFVIGQTSLDDVRLTLNRIANQFSTTASAEELDKLFYGEIDTEIPLYISRIDTIGLINNTNNVRIVLHWDHSGELKETDEKIDYDEVRVRLNGSNAIYGFGNNLVGTDNVVYMPWSYYYTDSILNVDKDKWLTMYYYSNAVSEVTNSCVYDFSILRMVAGSPIYLTVERKKPVVPDPVNLLSDQIDVMQTFTIFFDNQSVPAAQRQNMFDKNEYYRIDLYFTYDFLANTYVSGSLQVRPWTVIEQPEVPMN